MPIFLNVNSPVFHLSGNKFTFTSEFADKAPITIQVANGESIIEDSEFNLDGTYYWFSILSLQFINDASLSIYNCCFVNPGISHSHETSLFLTLDGRGTLKLSVVCFNAAQSSSILHKEGSAVKVQYDTTPEDIFSDGCVCWVPPSIPEETSSSQLDPSTPTPETSTNTHNPDQSFTPTGTEEGPDDPDSGSGGKANAGLIAGVTIAVIIIIIVVIVILILRPRRSQDSAEPESSSDELTEENITTFAKKPDIAEDWTNVTEDNPIFGADSVDQGNFTDQFEEEGTENWFHE